jgi:predicted Zn-dependent peptidase
MSTFPSEPPQSGQPRPWTFPDQASITLASGLRIAAVRMPALPIVQVRWSFRGGRRDEPLAAIGAGRLLQSVMRHGTSAYGSAELADALDQLGARLSISLACDSGLVGVSALTAHLPRVMDLVEEVVFRPTLPEAAIDRERSKALEVHRHERQQPEAIAGDWLAWRLYGKHPYGRPASTEYGLMHTDRDVLQALHARIFHPGHGLLLVVGDVDPEATVAGLAERYAGLSGVGPTPPPPTGMEVAPMAQSLTLIERPGSQQTAISLGMSGPSRSHADYHPLRLANQVFGGGASSRLFMELRERRSLTYGAYSMLDCGLWAGDLTASLSCAVDKSLEAVQALQAEVRRMADGVVDESDLDHARRYLIGSFPQRASGVAGVASLCNAGWLHSLPADTWSRYQAELSAVPSEAVVQASRDWFRPELAALVIVGAGEALDAVQGPLENEGLPVVRTDMSDTRFEGPHP